MKYLYIHGANATSTSFTYIREHLRGSSIDIDYNCSTGFEHNLKNMYNHIKDTKNIFVIAHSMGGIYALHLANMLPENFVGAVTISTPYGGANVAEIAKWIFPFYKLIHDIVPDGKFIKSASALPVIHPWTQIVTVSGHVPWIMQQNDGIVSIPSMKCRTDMQQIELHLNHYEVMVSPQTVKVIKNKVKEVDKRFKVFGM